jgi:hypothetical protein
MLLFHGMPDLSSVFAGFVGLITIKLIGYSLAGWTLQRLYNSKFNFLLFSVLRIVTGFVVGLMFLSVGFSVFVSTEELFGRESDLPEFVFLVLPIVFSRLVVWALLVWGLFERGDLKWRRFPVVVVLGTVWSFVLDAVALSLMGVIRIGSI